MAGAGAGGALAGLFSGSSDVPNYSDIDLKKDNPELWKQLQELKALTSEYERLYSQRRQGQTAAEKIQVEDSRSQLKDQLSNRGLVGSSAGAGMMGDYEARLQAAIAERAFQEEQQLLAALQNSRASYMNMLTGGQQMAMQPMMAEYGAQMGEDQARNQFFSGLFNSGLNLYASKNLGALNTGSNAQPTIVDMGDDTPYTRYGSQPGAPTLPGMPVSSSPQGGGRYMVSGFYPGQYEHPLWPGRGP